MEPCNEILLEYITYLGVIQNYAQGSLTVDYSICLPRSWAYCINNKVYL